MDVLTYGLLNKKVEEAKNVSGEKITAAVNTYLDENPPVTGATAEQAAQIDKNVADIGELKDDLVKVSNTVDEYCGVKEITIDLDDLSNYVKHYGTIGSNGKWVNINSKYQHIVIPIERTGTTFTMKVSSSSPTNLVYAGLTDYKTPVDGELASLSSSFGRFALAVGGHRGETVLPDDVKYIFLCLIDYDRIIEFDSFSIHSNASEGIVDGFSERIKTLENNVIQQPNNLYKNEVITGGYYDDNGVWVDNSNFKVAILPTDSVSDGDTIYYPVGFDYWNGSYRFDIFSSDGVWIKKYQLAENELLISDIGTESFYIAMRLRASADTSKLMIVNDGILEPTSKIEIVRKELLEQIPTAKKPKINILILGDSYSQGGRYINCLKENDAIGRIVNLGVAGGRIKDFYSDRTQYPYDGRPVTGGSGNNNTFSNQVEKLKRLMLGTDLDSGETKLYEDTSNYPDIILIQGGKNDSVDDSTDYEKEMWTKVNGYTENATSGSSVRDTYIPKNYLETDRTNFGGAMHYLYGVLHSIFSEARIFFITPSGINYSESNHKNYMVKSDQMRLVARYLCTPTIDWDLEGRLTYVDNIVNGSGTQSDPYTRDASSEYTLDSMHPNDKGARFLAECILAKLRSYGYVN